MYKQCPWEAHPAVKSPNRLSKGTSPPSTASPWAMCHDPGDGSGSGCRLWAACRAERAVIRGLSHAGEWPLWTAPGAKTHQHFQTCLVCLVWNWYRSSPPWTCLNINHKTVLHEKLSQYRKISESEAYCRLHAVSRLIGAQRGRDAVWHPKGCKFEPDTAWPHQSVLDQNTEHLVWQLKPLVHECL